VSPLVTGFTTGWQASAIGPVRQSRAAPQAASAGLTRLRTPAGPAATVGPMTEEYRIEHDSMGDVRVPAHAKWAAQTQRAVENFPISDTRVERSLIAALATLKGAAALVNARLKLVDRDVAQAVHEAAAEVM